MNKCRSKGEKVRLSSLETSRSLLRADTNKGKPSPSPLEWLVYLERLARKELVVVRTCANCVEIRDCKFRPDPMSPIGKHYWLCDLCGQPPIGESAGIKKRYKGRREHVAGCILDPNHYGVCQLSKARFENKGGWFF